MKSSCRVILPFLVVFSLFFFLGFQRGPDVIAGAVQERIVPLPGPWPEKEYEDLLLSEKDIKAINEISKGSSYYIDLMNLTQEEMSWYRQALSRFPEQALVLTTGEGLEEAQRQALLENAVFMKEMDSFAIMMERASMRALPTTISLVNPDRHPYFDRLQLSAIYPHEPLRLLGESADGAYVLALSDFYAGWVPADAVTQVTRQELQQFSQRSRFLTVQDNAVMASRVSDTGHTESVLLPMGTSIPLLEPFEMAGFVGTLSGGDYHGLTFDYQGMAALVLPRQSGVVPGYLPMTEKNLSEQMNKLLGEAYDWGGATTGRDCSALVRDIYSTFGLWIPRDSLQQMNFGRELDLRQHIAFSRELSEEEKMSRIAELPVGSLLFMPGHVMMVYAKHDGCVEVIHDYVAYYEQNEHGLEKVEAMHVGVSDLQILDEQGNTYLSAIYGAFALEKEPHETI